MIGTLRRTSTFIKLFRVFSVFYRSVFSSYRGIYIKGISESPNRGDRQFNQYLPESLIWDRFKKMKILKLVFYFVGVFYGQCSEICGANHRLRSITSSLELPRVRTWTNKWQQNNSTDYFFIEKSCCLNATRQFVTIVWTIAFLQLHAIYSNCNFCLQ